MENREDSELGALIRTNAAYFEAPQSLHDRIGAILVQTPSKQAPRKVSQWQAWQRWWGMGAAFAMGIMLSVSIAFLYKSPGQQDYLVAQVVDSHVRSLMVAHLSDVSSSDQHTVKPWLSHQLDYSPPVPDLKPEGFPLVGGRLDYIDARAVAALVYQRHLHTINVFVWPLRDKTSVAPTATSRQGFNVKSWERGGMQFWAVSDLQSTELEKFASLLSGRAGQP